MQQRGLEIDLETLKKEYFRKRSSLDDDFEGCSDIEISDDEEVDVVSSDKNMSSNFTIDNLLS